MSLMFDTVIVRYGAEIGVKSSRTRAEYDKLLIKSMKARLKADGLSLEKIERRFGRIYVRTTMPKEVALSLSRVFGISSTSPAISCKASLDEISNVALKLAEERGGCDVKFAVRCRRIGEHSFTSIDVSKHVGAKILESMKDKGWRVDLDQPDFTINIEIRGNEAFLYVDVVEGVGGLPQGSQGGLLCLMSSGIDSPVAAWLVMRRGCLVTLLHFNCQQFSGEKTVEKVVDLAKVLAKWSPAYETKLIMVPFGDVLKEIVEKGSRRLTCLLCKRMMLRIAEKVALSRGLMGIVTGDSIGEQASQTLSNMAVISSAVKSLPIYRPLLGFDKPETERIARKIGTYEISARPDEGCKAAPSKPAISAKLEEVLEAEKILDIDLLIETSMSRITELKV
ncbi:MAG: tRNA uracil 4-sulfurtransferase ThiI [Candidatus Nezhaarchaeales archaeon]|nr:MAG: tRNA 4-thiouridine(8) synthase ThiI [Candidatus Nezhaarchaeota archaeon WYZ-LMO8]TDA36543.1 MAG: tRNA 4-thiouridine(8) synthase ThiI [Candidatus Nezhaarchaeota archaeon WYZ-LMO7]